MPRKFLSDSDIVPESSVSVEYPTPKFKDPVGASSTSTETTVLSEELPGKTEIDRFFRQNYKFTKW